MGNLNTRNIDVETLEFFPHNFRTFSDAEVLDKGEDLCSEVLISSRVDAVVMPRLDTDEVSQCKATLGYAGMD